MNPNLSLADQNFKKNFVGGLLIIDCVEIKLTQNGTATPRSYASTGYLLATPENGIETRLTCLREEGTAFDPFAGFRERINITSGKLYPSSSYFKLEATDVQGHVWKHPTASVKVDERESSITLTVACDFIWCESACDSAESMTHMVFLDDLDFPSNAMHSSVTVARGEKIHEIKPGSCIGEAAGMRLTFDPRTDQAGPKYADFFAKALDGTTIPKQFENRLLEAIRFTTATMATPVMTETIFGKVRTLELRKVREANKGMVQPPIFPRGHEEAFFQLMGCYYTYACSNTKGNEFTPISTQLGRIFTLKHVWLDTIALLVAVGVESILNEKNFKKLGRPSKGLLTEIEKLFLWVKAAKEIEEPLLERALSALGSMKATRAADKLLALVEVGAIEEADRKAWKELRNPAAHGTFAVDPEKIQELLNSIYRLVTLIYKLIFLRIGYNGAYLDCSKAGWPIEQFEASTFQAALDAKQA